MNVSGQLWKAASLIGDRSRATMLWSLQGGESRPASELAMLANVSPQTASNHLRLLLDAGFVKAEAVGRNKFYRLAGVHWPWHWNRSPERFPQVGPLLALRNRPRRNWFSHALATTI